MSILNKKSKPNDIGHLPANVDLLLKSLVNYADTTISATCNQVDRNLQSALDRLIEFDLMLANKTTEGKQRAQEEISLAVERAIDAIKAAIRATETVEKYASDHYLDVLEELDPFFRQKFSPEKNPGVDGENAGIRGNARITP